jgi:hypothetical protein
VSVRRDQREPAVFHFDPHGGAGGPLGIGVVRTITLGTLLASGVLCLYRNHPLAAAALLLLAAPLVLARWEGLPMVTWAVLRTAYAVRGSRRWEVDAERVGLSEPIELTTTEVKT